MEENPAVVIDNGSGMIKAGIAGEDAPKAYFPSVVGVPKYEKIHGADEKDFYVGQDAAKKRGVLTLKYPIVNGIVDNWDDMSKIWYYCYHNELKLDPGQQPVLLTEAPLNPKSNREKMIEIFFEQIKAPSFYIFTQAVLSLYASGRTTGLVVDSGDGVTHIVAVFDGYSIQHVVSRMDVAGRNMTDYLQKHLTEDGYSFKSTAEKEIVKSIKEKMCRVALDYKAEMDAYEENDEKKREFELPDGKKIMIGNLAIRTPECLFNPSMLGLDINGIHKYIHNCVQMSDVDLRRDLYNNITLSGGTTMFEDFPARLNKEISDLVPSNVKVKVIAPVERMFSVWIGGSVLGSLATFQSSWITQAEFAETGPSIVHRKCV